MHLPYPPRKSSNPAPFRPRKSPLPGLRRTRLKLVVLVGLAFITLIYLASRPSSRHAASTQRKAPSGNPPAVLVTVLDETKYGDGYLETIKENRIKYAEKHGYETLFARVGDYDLKNAPGSWTKVVATRHALAEFPDCHYIWYLDQDAFIMNPEFKIEDHVMQPSRLDELMKKDFPVVPPDSIIKTFSHLKGQDVDLVVTQDKDGLSSGSFVVRNGEWVQFFLDTWFNPLYRSYDFQKLETHALEHIVQWHPTILAKMAIVEQDIINSYSKGTNGVEYKDGDFVVRFADCAAAGPQACEKDSQRFVQQWRKSFTNS